MKRRTKGFTLLELILVLALFGIVVILPTIKFQILDQIEAKEQLKMFIMDLESTKQNAIIHQKDTVVQVSNAGYICRWNNRSKEVLWHPLIEMTDRTNFEEVEFNSFGKPTKETAGSIIFTIQKKKYKITLQPVTGRIKFYEKYNEAKERGIYDDGFSSESFSN
ncbi:MAG: prepilin-type N-terminal cleavage/methylation domain-containing protein [Tissierellia bacterium]|nr:prepilin-type N-terminal cleavage/methylation domain-containing protein [Tissierellia bacterium]